MINLGFFQAPRDASPACIRPARFVASYRRNLSAISPERSSPVSVLWQSPTAVASLQPPAERPHVFPPNERAGAAAVVFRFYHSRAQPRSQSLGMRALSRLRLLGPLASGNGPSVRGTLSRGAHLVPGEEYAHFHRLPALRAQLVIDSHFRRGSTPSDTRRFVKVTRSRA